MCQYWTHSGAVSEINENVSLPCIIDKVTRKMEYHLITMVTQVYLMLSYLGWSLVSYNHITISYCYRTAWLSLYSAWRVKHRHANFITHLKITSLLPRESNRTRMWSDNLMSNMHAVPQRWRVSLRLLSDSTGKQQRVEWLQCTVHTSAKAKQSYTWLSSSYGRNELQPNKQAICHVVQIPAPLVTVAPLSSTKEKAFSRGRIKSVPLKSVRVQQTWCWWSMSHISVVVIHEMPCHLLCSIVCEYVCNWQRRAKGDKGRAEKKNIYIVYHRR